MLSSWTVFQTRDELAIKNFLLIVVSLRWEGWLQDVKTLANYFEITASEKFKKYSIILQDSQHVDREEKSHINFFNYYVSSCKNNYNMPKWLDIMIWTGKFYQIIVH